MVPEIQLNIVNIVRSNLCHISLWGGIWMLLEFLTVSNNGTENTNYNATKISEENTLNGKYLI